MLLYAAVGEQMFPITLASQSISSTSGKLGNGSKPLPLLPQSHGRVWQCQPSFLPRSSYKQLGFSLHKSTPITEETNLEFRAEFFNVFNHAQFSGVTGDILGSFGAVTSARAPRIGQLALKLSF